MERLTRRSSDGSVHASRVGYYDILDKLARYEDLEEKLQSVYGECDGLLETAISSLVKHEGAEFEKPMKARLLTDEDVDKWDRLKGAKERIVERLEEYRDDFMNDIYEELRDDFDNLRANRIIERFDDAIEIVKEEMGYGILCQTDSM